MIKRYSIFFSQSYIFRAIESSYWGCSKIASIWCTGMMRLVELVMKASLAFLSSSIVSSRTSKGIWWVSQILIMFFLVMPFNICSFAVTRTPSWVKRKKLDLGHSLMDPLLWYKISSAPCSFIQACNQMAIK